MKRIFSIIFLLFLCFHTSLMAQRTMNTLNNQFGSSANGLDRNQYDRNGNPIDTTAVVDANTIPIGLYSWKVDSRFGNVTYIPVDTLQHAFQNSNDMGEVAEWSIAAVLKTVVLRGTRGSNPCLSATNAENQQIAKQTPSFTPKNVKSVFLFYLR